MESTDSCTRSTTPAAGNSPLSPASRRENGNKLAQQKSPAATSSRAPPPSASAEFKCKYCPRSFGKARSLAGHQKAHRDLLDQILQNYIQDEHPPAAPQVRGVSLSSLSHAPALGSAAYFDFHTELFNSYRALMHNLPSSARSAVVPLFAGTGGLVPAQPSAAAIGGGGQKETSSQYFFWHHLGAVPSFVPQTQTGNGLPQPSIAAPARVAEGDGGTGDGVHLGRRQDMLQVNEEGTTDGIDLTLRL